ncbi:MAG: aldehyde ferredoxin oxidoreductase family protein [Oscillospiraceae bacterium]|nr:aldehyde ferredoxin oxidoreductase family protein [Oscillospiraceae bacterium]
MLSRYGGYMGKVMILDLTTGKAEEYPWTDKQREMFIGGKMMAAKILDDNFSGSERPFSEENLIVISTGPLTGTGAPSSSRFNLSTLSPQTGLITSSNCGGTFGWYLKKAGMDALILKGKCPERSWLEIHNDKFIFHSAQELWGMKTTETQDALTDLLSAKAGKKARFGKLCIGPAGENLVLYSAVVSDERAGGRTGVGAVFGWKNLKAITVSGNHDIPISNPEKTAAHLKKWFKYLRNHPLTGNQLPRLGTAGLVSSMQMRGLLSTKNYNYGHYEDFEKVNGETLAEEHNIVNKGCLSCPIKCARTVNVCGHEVKGPELETLGLLGGGILNNDLEKILRWNNELDELGMDTISAASTLAYAMEANEKGLWDNGLRFGDTDGISAIWEDIAYRRGVGAELADGSRRLSERYGGKEFAIQSKGLELAAYEPRKAVGMGLGYAVSNRGGCHLNGGYMVIMEGLGLNINSQTPHAKADGTGMFQHLMEMISASGQCLFTSYAFFPGFLLTRPNGPITSTVNFLVPYLGWALRFLNKFPTVAALHLPVFHHTKMIKYALGMPMTFGKYMRCGERGYNLERKVNAKFGVSAFDDTLPKRLTDVPQNPDDPTTKVPLEKLKKTYYRARGWNQNGLPTKATLRKLKIDK